MKTLTLTLSQGEREEKKRVGWSAKTLTLTLSQGESEEERGRGNKIRKREVTREGEVIGERELVGRGKKKRGGGLRK